MSKQAVLKFPAKEAGFVTIEARMPTGTHDHLQQLYDRKRMLDEEAGRLETERETLDAGSDQTYILDIEVIALREESTRVNARIADILERDLQR
jgi:hypothetical protein